jgi:poly-gamma-glutamate synthesis protein (capsule biosynthesis protein)
MLKSKIHLVKIILVILFLLVAGYFLNKNIGRGEYVNNNIDLDSIKKTEDKKELNLLLVGDIMLDRNIRKKIIENKSPENFVDNFLGNLREQNKNYDYVVGNLEGPITDNNTKTYDIHGKYTGLLTFTFSTSTPEILKLLNIKVVSLANNHTDNFDNQGFQDTMRFLGVGNIKYFGNPYNQNINNKLSNIVCEKEICIAYIGYNQFTSNNDPKMIDDEIKLLKQNEKVDFIVVVPHWGIEYSLTANLTQKRYAKEWIDAGADLVVGMHPHVIENSEIYKEKYIYYSLGNYIFDQWFNEDVKNGLALNFKFTKDIIDNKVIRKVELIKEIKIRSEKDSIKYKKD